MSFMRLAFSSDGCRTLSSLEVGERAIVAEVVAHPAGRADRLLALGVTPFAHVTMLQRFPGIVFLCDQTELAIERSVADAIVVRPQEG
jgi:Fe2+ transport system protein FeoA